MLRHLFSKIFTGIVALSFVAVSVVAPVGVRTVHAYDFDIAALTSGMSVEEDLAGMALSCVASAYVKGPLTASIKNATDFLSTAIRGMKEVSADPFILAENTAYKAAQFTAAALSTVAAPALAGGVAAVEAGAGLIETTAVGGGIYSVAVSGAPVDDAVLQYGTTIQLAAQGAQTAGQGLQMAGQAAEIEHQGLMDTYNLSAGSAKTSNNVQEKTADGVFDCIVYTAGQLMLNQLTTNIVSWIQGGFDGSPSFTLNTHEIFLQLADMVAGDLAREIRGIAMCNFSVNFKNDLANRVELSAKYDYKFDDKTKCPFPETYNINSSDFYQGVNAFSWGAMEYALQDSGNPFGVSILTNDELARRTSEKKEVRKQELGWSNGFTAMVDTNQCDYPGEVGTMVTYYNAEKASPGILTADELASIGGIDQGSVNAWNQTYCKTTTPGKIVGDSLTKATGIDMDRLGMIDNINKIIAATIEQITKQAAMGIFCAVGGEDGCDNGLTTDYVYIASKTAETVAMENAAIQPCYDAWQDEMQKKSDAETELASLKESLADAQEDGKEGADIELQILAQESIIAMAGDDTSGEIGAAKAKYDEATSAEYSVQRASNLDDANTAADTAKAAQDTAETNYASAYNTYYDYLAGSITTYGYYVAPDSTQLAAYKTAMDTAQTALDTARANYQAAADTLNAAQNPDYGC